MTWFKPRRVLALAGWLAGLSGLVVVDQLGTSIDPIIPAYLMGSVVLVMFIDIVPWFDPPSVKEKKMVWRDQEGEERHYCPDCGKGLVVWKRQSGFDQKTGMPVIERKPRCPDWDEVAYQATYTKMAKQGLSMFGLGNRDWACGNMTGTPTAVVCHEPPIHTCGVCVDRLVKEGKLTEDQARMLLMAS